MPIHSNSPRVFNLSFSTGDPVTPSNAILQLSKKPNPHLQLSQLATAQPSYFQQIQPKILTDFNQDATLFCTVTTYAFSAITVKYAVGKSSWVLDST